MQTAIDFMCIARDIDTHHVCIAKFAGRCVCVCIYVSFMCACIYVNSEDSATTALHKTELGHEQQ